VDLLIKVLWFAPRRQSSPPFVNSLSLVQVDGSFGFINPKEFVIPADYEEAFPFSDGLAAVKIDGLTAYIDQTGEVILQTEFENAGDFSEGLASFESENP